MLFCHLQLLLTSKTLSNSLKYSALKGPVECLCEFKMRYAYGCILIYQFSNSIKIRNEFNLEWLILCDLIITIRKFCFTLSSGCPNTFYILILLTKSYFQCKLYCKLYPDIRCFYLLNNLIR